MAKMTNWKTATSRFTKESADEALERMQTAWPNTDWRIETITQNGNPIDGDVIKVHLIQHRSKAN